MEPGDAVVDDDGVVRIGSVVFALIRPTEGRERAFNHWYERDHFYTTGLAAPGVFSAGRFIEPAMGAHLALYFVLPGWDDARLAFAMDQVADAAAENRTFADREHLHTWSYAVDRVWRADPNGVPPALALDHRYPAVSVGMFDTDVELPLAGEHAVDSVLILRPNGRIMPSTWDGDFDPARRRLAIAFHRDAPAADPFAGSPGLAWSSVLTAMVIGTDTHIDG